jgi:bisphosphoglycerate-dependent phosphoglycerate mutase
MLDQRPKSESLFNTMERSKIDWGEVLNPALLRRARPSFVVGHKNNLRSLIMQFEARHFHRDDVINLSLYHGASHWRIGWIQT